MRAVCREENHVIALNRQLAHTSGLAQHALAAVAVDGISKTLRRNEGDPSRVALVKPCHTYAQEGIIEPLPAGEDPLKFRLGFDGLHAWCF